MLLSLTHLFRTIIGIIDLMLVTTLMYLLSYLPRSFLGNWYRKLFRYWCWVFIRALNAQLFIHQKNLRPLPSHYILIANHPSVFEDLGMSAAFDAKFLAKAEMKDWWILGRISQACGTYYVQRESKTSRNEAQNTLQTALEKGENIGIYPEGGCKGRRVFLPFRFGIFETALKTGVPIIPVFLHYEAQEDFEWQNQHLIHKLWMILRAKNHRVNYYVYDAINPNDFQTKESLCEHVQNLYLCWQARYLD